jgi:predicted RNA binding protein YcfA (HicA-like mRNA interferase family)
VPGHGKGSHGRLWVGERFTWVPRSELGPGLLRAMLNQLQIAKEEF